jgi:DNA polymerase III epsilon subunit-like protein
MTAPIVFLDTETTGLHPLNDQVWEIAAIRREPDGQESQWHMLVGHAPPSEEYLASDFAADYKARYDPERAVVRAVAVDRMRRLFAGRVHLVGMVPSFDAERLGHMRRLAGFDEPDPWHYHLIDVETLVVGYLAGLHANYDPAERRQPPWDSEELSRAVGVNPDDFARHTAMGDVLWCRALYDAVMGGAG